MDSVKLNKELITKDSTTRLYGINIPVIGLTGGIATGKSSASRLYKDNAFPLICADELVHNIYKRKESLEFIGNNWPESLKDGDIDFAVLRKIFFNDSETQTKIENFNVC